MRRCDKCDYWEVAFEFKDMEKEYFEGGWTHPDDRIGQCRRYPPQLDSGATKHNFEQDAVAGCEADVTCWYQPLTSGNDWCGDFILTHADETPANPQPD